MATHTFPTSQFQASHVIDDEDAPPSARARQRPAFLRRVYDAVLRSQMRRAEREIDRVLGPGALTRAFRAELPPER